MVVYICVLHGGVAVLEEAVEEQYEPEEGAEEEDAGGGEDGGHGGWGALMSYEAVVGGILRL